MLNDKERGVSRDQGIAMHGIASGYSEMDDVVIESKPRTEIVLCPHMSDDGIGADLIRYRKGI